MITPSTTAMTATTLSTWKYDKVWVDWNGNDLGFFEKKKDNDEKCFGICAGVVLKTLYESISKIMKELTSIVKYNMD